MSDEDLSRINHYIRTDQKSYQSLYTNGKRNTRRRLENFPSQIPPMGQAQSRNEQYRKSLSIEQ